MRTIRREKNRIKIKEGRQESPQEIYHDIFPLDCATLRQSLTFLVEEMVEEEELDW